MMRIIDQFARPQCRSLVVAGIMTVLVVAGWMCPSPAASQDRVGGEEALQPGQHFSIDRPGTLSKEDATVIYDTIAEDMGRRFAMSGEASAKKYLNWTRYNNAPFLSATHGSRYVNIYANGIARKAGYGDMKQGAKMPAGAFIAKDSFTFTDDHALFYGALFIMEKLPKDASPETEDWRYLMILPDGSIFADSSGDTGESTTFCVMCHEKVENFDYLFSVPEDYRLPTAFK